MALLTVLPMFAMGATSLCGAAVGQRIGARGGVALGLGAIAFACASRYVAGGAAALLWSAALAGAGVGLVQALMPGVVKQAYPARIGVMTGLHSAAIMGGGGLGAMASPWVAHAFGGAQPDWHAGLAIWALLAAFALLYWLNMRRMEFAVADAPRQNLSWLRCFASRRAWLLAACFGLINGGYTSLVAWLPHFHAQQGWTAQQGGSVLALMTAAQVVAALAMPAIARSRGRDLRPWLVLTLVAQLAGFCALTFDAPVPAVAIAVVLGFGLGGAFSLCMVLALDHLPDPAQAGALAGFMQGVGFMIAALAPFVTGWVREQHRRLHACVGLPCRRRGAAAARSCCASIRGATPRHGWALLAASTRPRQHAPGARQQRQKGLNTMYQAAIHADAPWPSRHKRSRSPAPSPSAPSSSKDGVIVGEGFSHSVAHSDPTSHGEVEAIRDACRQLGTVDLSGCELYTSCEPCAMCVAAMHIAGIGQALLRCVARAVGRRIQGCDCGGAPPHRCRCASRRSWCPAAARRSLPAEQKLDAEAVRILSAWAEPRRGN